VCVCVSIAYIHVCVCVTLLHHTQVIQQNYPNMTNFNLKNMPKYKQTNVFIFLILRNLQKDIPKTKFKPWNTSKDRKSYQDRDFIWGRKTRASFLPYGKGVPASFPPYGKGVPGVFVGHSLPKTIFPLQVLSSIPVKFISNKNTSSTSLLLTVNTKLTNS